MGKPCAPFSVILGGKTNPPIGKGGNAVIADRYLMGIVERTVIVYHSLWVKVSLAICIANPFIASSESIF
jgi:hypothetical protein